MKNVNMVREGDKLVITIDLSQTFGRSASGKTTIIASTEGNVCPPANNEGKFDPNMKIGINVYMK